MWIEIRADYVEVKEAKSRPARALWIEISNRV